MNKRPIHTPEQIREHFDYNPDIGLLCWRKPTSLSVRIGQEAGTVETNGRRSLRLQGRNYQASHVVWCHFYGEWPKTHVCVRDGDPLNLAINNLVLAKFDLPAEKELEPPPHISAADWKKVMRLHNQIMKITGMRP